MIIRIKFKSEKLSSFYMTYEIEIFIYDLYKRSALMTQGKTYMEAVEYFLKLLDEYEKKINEFDRLDLANTMLNILSMIFTSIRGWSGWYFSIKFASEYLDRNDMVKDVRKMIEIARQLLSYDLERTKEWLKKYESKHGKIQEGKDRLPQSI